VSALLRHNSLVVSAGPIGGGGSNVYGELPCGKIYTVFLPTGAQQWSLQFCQRAQAGTITGNRATTAVVHTEPQIIPPEAKERYDFRRIPLPPEKAHKLITLRGVITEEGTVEHIEVHQGVLPILDEAARLAFRQWKFRPAMRSGKAIEVEILVAIPADPPRQR
jgi:TonB family protein